MTEGIAGVQSRILEIQSRFPAPAAAFALQPPATAGGSRTTSYGGPAPTSGGVAFAQALATTAAGQPAPAATAAAAVLGGSPTVAATPPAHEAPAARGSAVTGEQAVAKAKEHLGTPYVWGGAKPGGFDCSGLMQWSYRQLGVELPRVSRDQAKAGRPVTAAEARPGDLVFFDRAAPAPDHIGMYAGNGQWVVAPRTGDVVKMQKVDLSKATTIRRVVPDTPAEATATGAATAAALRAASPAPAAAAARGASPYASLFASAGARHGVSPTLLTAVARAESGFDAAARSPAGAQGLMQFMPATARGLGVDPWDPASAVDGAARLLKQHLQRFGSTELALAAYNAGPGAVTSHGGIPPYRETQDYVRKIMSQLRSEAA